MSELNRMKNKTMQKQDLEDYLNRWKIVNEFERQEIKNASEEELFKQFLSIWSLAEKAGFFENPEETDYINNPWTELKLKWIDMHERDRK